MDWSHLWLSENGQLNVIARFASPLLSFTEGLFPFPYADLSSLFDKSRAKIYTFFHIYTPYLLCKMHIHWLLHYSPRTSKFVPEKYKNEVGFPCHDRISMILGLPYTRNVPTQPFSYIMKDIKAQFRAMEKRIKHSTLREKLLWRNCFILSLHPFVPQV
jgi:hypothetical protein